MGTQARRVVLDTNILVAAGFNAASSAARIVQAIEDRQIELVWNQATKAESKKIIERIPPLTWARFEALFERGAEYTGPTDPQRYQMVKDADDRKFAALAAAVDAVLVSNDEHLLSVRRELDVPVLTPREMVMGWG